MGILAKKSLDIYDTPEGKADLEKARQEIEAEKEKLERGGR